jgi:hypothetical protein
MYDDFSENIYVDLLLLSFYGLKIVRFGKGLSLSMQEANFYLSVYTYRLAKKT